MPVLATSPAAHRPGQRRRAVEVGHDPAALVVRGRRDRKPVGRGVEVDGPHRGRDRREALVEVVEARGVEPQVVDVLLEHPGSHRA